MRVSKLMEQDCCSNLIGQEHREESEVRANLSNQKNPAQGLPEGQAVNILILVKDNIINIFDMLIIYFQFLVSYCLHVRLCYREAYLAGK